jgi:F-type H+-transporting ATPase subunit gamma
MATHSRLKQKHQALLAYQKQVEGIFCKVVDGTALHDYPLLMRSDRHNNGRRLMVIIGSQKGLCGNFNTMLIQICKYELEKNKDYSIITVGKRAHEFVVNRLNMVPYKTFDMLTAVTYLNIANQLTSLLMQENFEYQKVLVVVNIAKSFLSQVPKKTWLVPFIVPDHSPIICDDYLWDQKPSQLLSDVLQLYIMAQLEVLLYESLIAEQAARFLSMDSSTRNATNLLDSTKLKYNKLRQAKITKELIELSTSLE